MAQTVGFLRVAVVARSTVVLGGESLWGLPVLLFCLWEKVLAEGIPLVTMLIFRAAAEPRY